MWLPSYIQFITDRFGKAQHHHLFGGAGSRLMASLELTSSRPMLHESHFRSLNSHANWQLNTGSNFKVGQILLQSVSSSCCKESEKKKV